MKSNSFQKEAFLDFEANAWFSRNKKVLLKYSPEKDKIISLIQNYQINPSTVLEIGCSAGYRLNGIKSKYPNSEVYGVEPSDEAISFGEKAYPAVNFIQGTCDNLNKFTNEKIDLVIIGFVFYVVDRNLLLKSISEVDRVLKDNGVLILVDFYSERAVQKNYHHITNFDAFSFKQRYDEVFSSTKLYQLIDRTCYHHEMNLPDISSDFQELYSISLLKKDLIASYR